MNKSTRIGVDVGGTFTDLVLHDEEQALTWTGKRLTTPDDPSRAIVEGITRLLQETGTPIERVGTIVHGTTLITNTVLERTGAVVGLITTDGFRDILEMGREIRFDVEDLYARPAPAIVPRHLRTTVPGRIRADGTEHAALDEEAVKEAAKHLVETCGAESLAIAFMHAYANPSHEHRARALVQELYPDVLVSLSAEVAPEIREYERTNTACINAYVQPGVHGYLDQLERVLQSMGFDGRLHIMLSGGGVTTVQDAKAFPVRLLESGPAAGAIAAGYLARNAGETEVISFDMGGTTAKMCLIEGGKPNVKHEFEAGRLDKFKPGSGLPLQLTVIDMIEIGSGGGSIASVDDLGLLKVGPRSAGSDPGPVAYAMGGTEPTVTDSDLLLGLLDPAFFLGGEMKLALHDVESAVADKLATPLELSSVRTATGIQSIVTENMAAATRMHLAEKGRNPADYALMAFGGAGPVHAYSLAKLLKVKRVIVPMGAGVISAFGFLVASPLVQDVRGYAARIADVDWRRVADLYREMEHHAHQLLSSTTERDGEPEVIRTANMRYLGQGFEIEVALPTGTLDTGSIPGIESAFLEAYRNQFGRSLSGGSVEVISWRLTARLPETPMSLVYQPTTGPVQRTTRRIHFPTIGEIETRIYNRYALSPGDKIAGPALFEERETSCSFGPDCEITVDENYNLVADIA